MKSDDLLQRWRESGWRRKLGAEEAAALRGWLATHPEARDDWQLEQALTHALDALPDAPMPSNFTTRVIEAVRHEATAASRNRPLGRRWWQSLGWAPRLAFAVVLLGAGVLSVRQYQANTRRHVAESVVVLADSGVLADVDILEDFDAIQRISGSPPPDEELLTLLQ